MYLLLHIMDTAGHLRDILPLPPFLRTLKLLVFQQPPPSMFQHTPFYQVTQLPLTFRSTFLDTLTPFQQVTRVLPMSQRTFRCIRIPCQKVVRLICPFIPWLHILTLSHTLKLRSTPMSSHLSTCRHLIFQDMSRCIHTLRLQRMDMDHNMS